MLLKIITIIFVLLIGSKITRKFRERLLSVSAFIFSLFILASILLVVLEPHISDIIAHLLGVQHGTDIAFFSSILLLVYLVFRLYSKIILMDKEITNLNTTTSIELHKIKKGDEKK